MSERALIRPLVPQDSAQAAHIFFDAVHAGTARVYSREQRLAWAGDRADVAGWANRFAGQTGFAADWGGEMVGFMTVDHLGYLDLAFVDPKAGGRGIGRQLSLAIEDWARSRGIARLTCEASLQAEPFFARMGWQLQAAQVVIKRGVEIPNSRMFKVLHL